MHRPRRRSPRQLVLLPRGAGGRRRGDDDRGARGATGVRAARRGVHPSRGTAVRLLHAGDAAHGQLAAGERRARERGADQAQPVRESLSLHRLPRHRRSRRRPCRSRMTTTLREPATRTQIGRSQPRRDAREKLRGEAQCVGDILVPRMLHGKVLRSPIAHGRVVSIDTSSAERVPGVVCVLTGADLRDIDPYYGHAIKDRPILAIDKVRFHGEQVAAVAAETPSAAAAAVEAIVVEYEELPVVATVQDAVAEGASLVTDRPTKPGLFHGLGELPPRDGNVCYRYALDRGELEAVFARADIVVEGEYTFPSVYQYAMETHTVIAQVEGDEITLWATCQHPFLVRAEIADLFGVPVANVRIQVPYLGGGFGSKSYTKMEPLTVALARKAGRPVRIQNSVRESMVTTRRHNMSCRMRTAATADGRLLAREVDCLFDTGAYADNGPRVVATAGDAAPGPYRWTAYRVDASCVYTNLAPAGSYRAFGATHMQWIGESQVDEVARRCGLDPLEVRRQNLCLPGEEVRAGGKPLDADLIGDVAKVAAAVGWGEERRPHVGRGVSVGLLAAGAHPLSSAVCRLEADGGVVVLVATTEMGQGPRTAFAQIAAEEIGVDSEQVTVRGADTRFTPYDRSTGASRSTTIAGLAVQRAAADIRTQLERIAGSSEIEPGRLTELMRRHFGFAGGELIGRGEVSPVGTGSYDDGPGPYGAKGCGEGALAAVPAAVVNALADAGVPMRELPLTPERVWRRIQDLKEEGKWQQ